MIGVSSNTNILSPNELSFDERQKQLEVETIREKRNQENMKKSPFDNFVQFNRDMYKQEDWLMRESPTAYRIFKFLIHHMDGKNAIVCSYKVLQEYFEISQPTVARAIKLLREKRYLEVYRSGSSNIYSINKNIVWSSWGTNYKYGKCDATILISESEQDKKKPKKEKIHKIVIDK